MDKTQVFNLDIGSTKHEQMPVNILENRGKNCNV